MESINEYIGYGLKGLSVLIVNMDDMPSEGVICQHV